MTFARALAIALLLPGLLAAREADPSPLLPLPSVPDFTRGGGWGLALGVGAEYEAAYDGSDEYEFEVEPAGAVQWRDGRNMFFWEGTELGWRGRIRDPLLLQAGARYESGLEPDDSEAGHLDGLPERDRHVVGFLEARHALDPDWRTWVGARVMGGESGFGWLGVLAFGLRLDDRRDGLGTELYTYATFGDAAFINKDFGVSAADAAASGLSADELDGGYRSAGVNLIHRRELTASLQLMAAAEAEVYNGQIADSPIARDGHEAGVELSLVWVF